MLSVLDHTLNVYVGRNSNRHRGAETAAGQLWKAYHLKMATEAGAQVVQSLFVTLRRGFAGTPWQHRRILEALGLKRRHQCLEKPNNSMIRGMLSKVRA